jgi:hypothetical protein
MLRLIPLLALLVFTMSARCETPWPLRTPAELKALHGPTFTGMQILTYRRTQDPKVEGAAPQTVIGIGQDIIYREDGQIRRVVDLRLGRVYNLQGTRYFNTPIAPEIVIRENELANRIGLSKAVAAAGIERDRLDVMGEPYWRAVDLKVMPTDEPPPVVKTRHDGGETVFLYNDSEVVRWRPADKALAAPQAANLARVLLWFFKIHPSLIAQLVKDGTAPRHLTVHWRLADKPQSDDYQLVSSQWCAACEALPAKGEPGLFIGGVLENEMAPIMIAAAQGKFTAVSSEEYLHRIDAALDKGATLEAFLWFNERLLQYGVRKCQPTESDDYCRVQNRLVAQIQWDADVRSFSQARSKASIESANAIAGLRSKVGPNAYYIDLSSANAIPPSAIWFKSVDVEPLKSADKRMASALAGMPMVPAVYRDIGNMYFNAMNVGRAWLAWEMGRAIPGRSMEPNMWARVDAMEATTRQRHPEFY